MKVKKQQEEDLSPHIEGSDNSFSIEVADALRLICGRNVRYVVKGVVVSEFVVPELSRLRQVPRVLRAALSVPPLGRRFYSLSWWCGGGWTSLKNCLGHLKSSDNTPL